MAACVVETDKSDLFLQKMADDEELIVGCGAAER